MSLQCAYIQYTAEKVFELRGGDSIKKSKANRETFAGPEIGAFRFELGRGDCFAYYREFDEKSKAVAAIQLAFNCCV